MVITDMLHFRPCLSDDNIHRRINLTSTQTPTGYINTNGLGLAHKFSINQFPIIPYPEISYLDRPNETTHRRIAGKTKNLF